MKPSKMLKEWNNELSEKAKEVIATSDQSFDEWAGEFETPEDFNNFVDENYN